MTIPPFTTMSMKMIVVSRVLQTWRADCGDWAGWKLYGCEFHSIHTVIMLLLFLVCFAIGSLSDTLVFFCFMSNLPNQQTVQPIVAIVGMVFVIHSLSRHRQHYCCCWILPRVASCCIIWFQSEDMALDRHVLLLLQRSSHICHTTAICHTK